MNLLKASVTNNIKRKETDKSWMWDMTGKDILEFFNKSTACARNFKKLRRHKTKYYVTWGTYLELFQIQQMLKKTFK